MRKLTTAFMLSAMLGFSAGCAQLVSPETLPVGPMAAPATAPASHTALARAAANLTGLEGCEVLGLVTANAECACYDRMSYEQVRGQASSNVLKAARSKYPDTDVVRVASVDLYLNNAVAHGVAYRCAPRGRT